MHSDVLFGKVFGPQENLRACCRRWRWVSTEGRGRGVARNKLTNIKAPPRQVGKRRIPQTSVIQHHPSSLSTYSTGWTWLPGLKLGTGPNLLMPDMVDARRAHMPGISHLLAISCLLILCPCNHSLESCKNSKIEH